MQVRRIVTGHDADGKAVFVSDDAAPRATDFVDLPGHGFAQLWSSDYPPDSDNVEDPTLVRGSLVPAPGGVSMLMVSFPPDSVMAAPIDPQRAFSQMSSELPGFIECFEPDSPGMHKTPTIDYGVLLEGELWLDLDNGNKKCVRPGDVVIQNATRHAWRNKTDQVAKAVFFMHGAD